MSADRAISVSASHMGMTLAIDALDAENLAYFRYCADGEFRLQRGKQSGLLRYPPTTTCPWTSDPEYDWVSVEGKGVVYSYTEVHHAIQPAFRNHTPYLLLLVELDTQKGQPSPDESLKIVGNLLMPDGEFATPELVRSVGIGTRVRMIFTPVADGLALPNWIVDDEAEQPEQVWRFPEPGRDE